MSSEIYFQRGLGLLLVFWLFSNSGVECKLETAFQKCCAIGRNKNAELRKCEGKIATPVSGIAIEQQSVCLSIIDLCCVQSLRDIACERGNTAALQNKNCNAQSKTDDDTTYKHCCEACKLGIISASMVDEGCKLKNFHFGHPWDSSYESCCSDSAPRVSSSEQPRDLCQLLPGELCSHTCVPVGGSYKCQCRPGYALMADGKSCRPDIVENRCEKNNICDQNCYDNGETLECSCNVGYELLANNRTCDDIDECNLKLDNCSESGKICLNTWGSFKCVGKAEKTLSPTSSYENTRSTPFNANIVDSNESLRNVTVVCVKGYQHDVQKNTCVDINECEERNPCKKNTEICLNTPGSYHCMQTSKCSKGFVYNAEVNGCVDVDECQQSPCASNELCQNQPGSYVCHCKPGFQRDQITLACVDVNECQLRTHECPETSRCDNTVGSYQCTRSSGCGTGYTLNLETSHCEDDNECAMGIDNCKLLGAEWECKNILGSFRCEKKRCHGSNPNCRPKPTEIHSCFLGYETVNGECVDIDECARGTHSCRSTETCQNTKGSFKCVSTSSCASGLRHNNQQSYCVDIDECVEQPSICDHNCINIWSSFFCTCNPGYRLHNDNRSCIDINECEIYKDRRLCIGYCVNTPGSYKCECPNGYRLEKFGSTCQDINECASGTVCNQPNEVCVNMNGSYRCNTITCPPNYEQDPKQKNRCSRVADFCTLNRNCTNWPMSYVYVFFALTSNFPISTTGQMEFYRLKGSSSSSTSSQFFLELKNVQAAPGVNKTTSDNFRLIYRSSNEVTVSLQRSIQGPQDIELHLKVIQFSYNGVNFYHSIYKIFVYVSEYDF